MIAETPNPTHEDWLFDVGLDKDFHIAIEPHVSTIPHVRFVGITREALIDLRKKINQVLKDNTDPEVVKARNNAEQVSR